MNDTLNANAKLTAILSKDYKEEEVDIDMAKLSLEEKKGAPKNESEFEKLVLLKPKEEERFGVFLNIDFSNCFKASISSELFLKMVNLINDQADIGEEETKICHSYFKVLTENDDFEFSVLEFLLDEERTLVNEVLDKLSVDDQL